MQSCFFPCSQSGQNPQWVSFKNKLLITSAVGTILALGLILAGATGFFGAHASIILIELGAIILTTTIIAPSLLCCIDPKKKQMPIEDESIVMTAIEIDPTDEEKLKELIKETELNAERLKELTDQVQKNDGDLERLHILIKQAQDEMLND